MGCELRNAHRILGEGASLTIACWKMEIGKSRHVPFSHCLVQFIVPEYGSNKCIKNVSSHIRHLTVS